MYCFKGSVHSCRKILILLLSQPGVGEGAATDHWSQRSQCWCAVGMLPGLCFKCMDGVWISFKVGTKVAIKQNVANTVLK